MKNYKILENRAELSKEQIRGGMDFSKIKINAALAKKMLLKSLIIKGAVSTIVVVSGIVLYNNFNSSSEKNSTKNMDTVVISSGMKSPLNVIKNKAPQNITKTKKQNNFVMPDPALRLIIDTPEKNTDEIEEVIFETPVVFETPLITMQSEVSVQSEAPDTPCQSIKATRASCQKNSDLIKTKRCVIWKTNNFCEFPSSAVFAKSYDCDACEFYNVDCGAVNELDAIKGVWLTIDGDKKSSFRLESHLENITLIRPGVSGIQFHPVMIALSNEGRYIDENFKAKNFIGHFKNQVDLFLLFPDAQIGDRVVIKNLMEAVIEE